MTPQKINKPSTEDRMEAMRYGHEVPIGLTLEEDEERLIRIAMRESAAESRRGKEPGHNSKGVRGARVSTLRLSNASEVPR